MRPTRDWRAVCGRTARTVRREGRRQPSLPLSESRCERTPYDLDARFRGHDTLVVIPPVRNIPRTDMLPESPVGCVFARFSVAAPETEFAMLAFRRLLSPVIRLFIACSASVMRLFFARSTLRATALKSIAFPSTDEGGAACFSRIIRRYQAKQAAPGARLMAAPASSAPALRAPPPRRRPRPPCARGSLARA